MPGALLADGGEVMVSGGGMKTNPISLTLSANTLYFLVVGCNGTVMVEGADSTSPLTGPLVGLVDFTTFGNSSIEASSWTYGSLPASFGTLAYLPPAPAAVPNVYVGP